MAFQVVNHGGAQCERYHHEQQVASVLGGTAQYRCYITDLDLSELLDDRLGATQAYLSYKRVLEQALNEGLEQVLAEGA